MVNEKREGNKCKLIKLELATKNPSLKARRGKNKPKCPVALGRRKILTNSTKKKISIDLGLATEIPSPRARREKNTPKFPVVLARRSIFK